MIEMMISVAILAMMIAGMTIAFQQQQRQFNFTREAADIDQSARSTLDFLATEIRNASSRQGKTFALKFFNGGSGENCADDTDEVGVNSPPDCFTVYTWDITRGQNGTDLPSVPALVQVTQSSPELKLLLPPQWFDDDGVLIGEPDEPDEPGDPQILLGLRSRVNLCNPDPVVNCGVSPEKCTECAVILRATVNEATKIATIAALDDIKEHNLPISSFASFNAFVNPSAGNFGAIYGFLPTFANQPAEMTMVSSKTFSINPDTRELLLSLDGEAAVPIAGGLNASGIVDMQLVFTLQNEDGNVTKVGVPLSAADDEYPDFSDTTLTGREQDIRTVEINILVRSRIKPQKMQGGEYRQVIPELGDVSQRTTTSGAAVPEEGYIYRLMSTTVYMRNHSREEFG